MNVLAVVVVADRRAGPSDPDVLSLLGDVPVVVHSVRAMRACGMDVVVSAPGRLRARVARACAEEPITVVEAEAELAGMVAQRTTSAEGDAFVLVHDAARPLAPPALTRTVVEAAQAGHRVVVPVLPLADTVKTVDAAGLIRGTPDRAGLRVVQTPQAVAVDLAPAVLSAARRGPALGWAAAGETVHVVSGHPLAFPVHRAWDLELAASTEGADG